MIINGVEFVSPLGDMLSELKSQLTANGIQLLGTIRESGDNIQCSCPYHKNGQERKPSFGIKKSDGVGHCFTCGEVHDLPEIVSYCFGRNDHGAFGWEWLRRNFLIVEEEKRSVEVSIKRGDRESERSRKKSEDSTGDIGGNTKYISEDELDSYRWTHPYWAKRGIVYPDIIELFDLGYDKGTHCITFPVRDIEGHCLFVAKRSVRAKFFHYPKGVEKPLYGLYEITKYFDSFSKDHSNALVIDFDLDINSTRPIGINFPQEVFVCESMIDCILLWQAGHYAVALNGVGNRLQMEQLTNLPCRSLIIATDNDGAGWDAFDKIKKYVKHKIFYRLIMPGDVKDIGEMSESQLKNLKWELM